MLAAKRGSEVPFDNSKFKAGDEVASIIINPLTGQGMDSLFSTHPPMEERIARLEAMANQMGAGQVQAQARPAAPASGPWATAHQQTPRRGPWG